MNTSVYECFGVTRVASDFSQIVQKTLDSSMVMDVNRHPDCAEENVCYWDKWHMSKGVTCSIRNISVYGLEQNIETGHHSALVYGFEDVDVLNNCYKLWNPKTLKGFGTFSRWMYVSDPLTHESFLGIDFDIGEDDISGMGNSMHRITSMCHVLASQGLSLQTPVILLEYYLWQAKVMQNWQNENSLTNLGEWCNFDTKLYPSGQHCPRCGCCTFIDPQNLFCFRCGFDKKLLNHHTSKGGLRVCV